MCIWVILVVTFYSIAQFVVLYVCGSLKVLELKDWSCQQPFLNANMRMCTLDKVVSGLYFDMVCQVRLGFDQCDRNSVIKQFTRGLSSVCVCACACVCVLGSFYIACHVTGGVCVCCSCEGVWSGEGLGWH